MQATYHIIHSQSCDHSWCSLNGSCFAIITTLIQPPCPAVTKAIKHEKLIHVSHKTTTQCCRRVPRGPFRRVHQSRLLLSLQLAAPSLDATALSSPPFIMTLTPPPFMGSMYESLSFAESLPLNLTGVRLLQWECAQLYTCDWTTSSVNILTIFFWVKYCGSLNLSTYKISFGDFII